MEGQSYKIIPMFLMQQTHTSAVHIMENAPLSHFPFPYLLSNEFHIHSYSPCHHRHSIALKSTRRLQPEACRVQF